MQDKMTITEARHRVDERFMLGEIDGGDADRRHRQLDRLSNGAPFMGMRPSYSHKRRLAATTAEA